MGELFMLSDEQKRQIEMAAAQQIRESWGGLDGARIRGVIDDVRIKLVEKAWFGEATSDKLNDYTYTSNPMNSDILGWTAEKAKSAWASVFGSSEPEREPLAPDAPQRGRDEPEIGG